MPVDLSAPVDDHARGRDHQGMEPAVRREVAKDGQRLNCLAQPHLIPDDHPTLNQRELGPELLIATERDDDLAQVQVHLADGGHDLFRKISLARLGLEVEADDLGEPGIVVGRSPREVRPRGIDILGGTESCLNGDQIRPALMTPRQPRVEGACLRRRHQGDNLPGLGRPGVPDELQRRTGAVEPLADVSERDSDLRPPPQLVDELRTLRISRVEVDPELKVGTYGGGDLTCRGDSLASCLAAHSVHRLKRLGPGSGDRAHAPVAGLAQRPESQAPVCSLAQRLDRHFREGSTHHRCAGNLEGRGHGLATAGLTFVCSIGEVLQSGQERQFRWRNHPADPRGGFLSTESVHQGTGHLARVRLPRRPQVGVAGEGFTEVFGGGSYGCVGMASLRPVSPLLQGADILQSGLPPSPPGEEEAHRPASRPGRSNDGLESGRHRPRGRPGLAAF